MTLRKKENKNNSNNSIYRRTAMCLMAVLVLCVFTFFGMSRVYADPIISARGRPLRALICRHSWSDGRG